MSELFHELALVKTRAAESQVESSPAKHRQYFGKRIPSWTGAAISPKKCRRCRRKPFFGNIPSCFGNANV
jgi:hypothetical protein